MPLGLITISGRVTTTLPCVSQGHGPAEKHPPDSQMRLATRVPMPKPIMGKGIARIVEDVEEKKRAMTILMKTQSGKDFEFADRLVSMVAVVRVDVSEYTAKHRPLPENLR